MEKVKNLHQIEDFMKLRSFALFGASAYKKKFGNFILSALLKRGYSVYPVHKTADAVDGIKCYRSLSGLPEKPGGVILSIPPEESEQVINSVIAAGINNVWFQQGAESPKAVNYCVLNGMNVVSGECILMFLEKAGFPHNFHRWVWGLGARA
jgi:predicted CoA-binding protein